MVVAVTNSDGRSVLISSVGGRSKNDIRSQNCDRPRSPLRSLTTSMGANPSPNCRTGRPGFGGSRPGARGLSMVGRITPTLIQVKKL